MQPVTAKPGEPRRPPLEGLDRAQAGVTTADFVTGGKPGAARSVAPIPVRATAPRNDGQRAGGLRVEVIRGDRSETVNY